MMPGGVLSNAIGTNSLTSGLWKVEWISTLSILGVSMTKCHFCAETIPEGTTTCPHCQTDLTGQNAPPLIPVPTSGKALASMVLGILGGFWITAILALVFGYQARSEIKQAKGHLAGDEMARAGIILGWVYAPFLAIIPIMIVAAIAIPNLLRSRMAANEASAVGSIRLLVTCAVTYQTEYPAIGYPSEAGKMGKEYGCIDPVLENAATGVTPRSGYFFDYQSLDSNGDGVVDAFSISAEPFLCERTGRRTFFTDETSVMRWENRSGCPAATAESPPL